VDTVVINVCSADKEFHSLKQELEQEVQGELHVLQQEADDNETLVSRVGLSRA
jgi:hypothetical protein